jgi:hypothetical protein
MLHFPAPRSRIPHAEDRVPPAPVNAVLRYLMVGPALCSWFRPPLGVSLLAVLRRKIDTVQTSPP